MSENPESNTVWQNKLTWFKSSSRYRALDTIWRRANGFRVEYFSGFTTCQLCSKVQEFMSKNERSNRIESTAHLCRCPTTSHGDLRTLNRNAMLAPNSFRFMWEVFTRKMVIPRTWIRKEVVFNSRIQTTRRMGQSRWINDDKIWRERTPSFPCHESLSRRTLKSNGGGKYRYTSVPMEIRMKLFAQLFLLISSVSTKQSQTCVRNTVPVKQERRDPCWQDNLTHCSSRPVCWWQHLHLRPERLSQQNRVIKICTGAGFLTTVEVGQYFMKKDIEEFSQFTEPVACREYTLPRDEKSSDPKGWIGGNTKIGPVLEVITSCLQGKFGVEIRIDYVNKDNSHSWVRTLMDWISWSQTWSTKSTTTTNRKPLRCSSKKLRWRRKYLLLRADQRLKHNHKDVLLPAHPQDLYPSGKESGLTLSQKSIR